MNVWGSFGGSGMIDCFSKWFGVRNDLVPPKLRKGLIVNIFKNGDRENPRDICT